MSTLYLDRGGTALRRDGRALAIYEDGRKRSTVPVALLERVVMAARVELDSGVLGFLADQGVAVLVLAGRHREQVAILTGAPHNEVTRRMAQYRLFADAPWRVRWSRRLVAHKLAAQERLLRTALRERPDRRYALTTAIAGLARLRARLGAEVDPGLSLEQLRGVEGAGAAAYFAGLAAVFPEALAFTSRNRRPPRDPVNAVLSLGYTILHGDAVQACHQAGLDPLVGYLHDLDYGRASLAADLVEPFRPRVDRLAWDLFRKRALRPEYFEMSGDGCLLNKAGRAAFYPAYEQIARPLRRAFRRLTLRVAQALPAMTAGIQGDATP